MSNKYHVSKRKYISRVFLSLMFSLFSTIIYISLFFNKNSEGEMLDNQPFLTKLLLFVVMIATLILSLVLFWIIIRKQVFYDEDKNFNVESGLFFKRKISVPYENIHTIAIKRSLLDLIIGTSKVEIDTGTVASPLPEGNLLLDKKYALVLKEYLENKKSDYSLELPSPLQYVLKEQVKTDVLYNARKRDLLKMGLLKQGLLLTLLLVLIFSISVPQISYHTTTEVIENFEKELFYLILAIIGLSIFTILSFVLGHLISFYNYKVSIKDGYLEYEYGLFSKTSFRVKISRINALYLKQSLGFRLFKYYSLEASIIGIGDYNQNSEDSTNESKYILPIAKKEQVEEILKLLSASELLEDNYIKPTKYRKLTFLYLPLMFISLCYIGSLIIFRTYLFKFYLPFISSLMIYVLSIIGLVLRMNNHGVRVSDNINVRNGSFTVIKTLIKKKRIQTINYKQGPIQLLLGIGTINLKYKKLLGNFDLISYRYEDFLRINEEIFK